MKKVIIIGGGVLGASTAYHLAKQGAEVLIVDRPQQGQATDAAAGIVCPWLSQRRNKAWYRLVKGGARYYPSLIRQLEEDGETETGYKQVGAISLHYDRGKLEKMAERAEKRREEAPEIGEIHILSKEDTQKLLPLLSEEYGSVYISGGARVNGRALRNALLNGAKKHGARFVQGHASLLFEGERVYGAAVEGERYLADEVVLTGGAWGSDLLKPLGLTFQVTFQKAQILHMHIKEFQTGDWPVVMPPNNQYLLSFEDGRIVAGATHEDNTGYDVRPTAGGIYEILDKTMKFAPGISNGEIIEIRVGFRPYTPGFLPIIGRIPGIEGALTANGLGASGLTSGPYLGAELARLALGIETELDLCDYPVQGAMGD
ncbi:FAD-binding oxidoreductase [Rossellomorea vietnamensis]|uniref:FAD-binding oxidoreductase n=2 Tax=Rossellomorea TaxID=2837508 RepID=A0A5D4KK73_9BACI|nr:MULTISPECIES: FAD-binding oxidoreductase [Rossellomorea]TYR77299.1 FAD-binding oxidoreductase [Rossellomorea vietnamensis]TYS78135.1 FAD-binding oxidoreductase [Rossellomorea aquimaris]